MSNMDAPLGSSLTSSSLQNTNNVNTNNMDDLSSDLFARQRVNTSVQPLSTSSSSSNSRNLNRAASLTGGNNNNSNAPLSSSTTIPEDNDDHTSSSSSSQSVKTLAPTNSTATSSNTTNTTNISNSNNSTSTDTLSKAMEKIRLQNTSSTRSSETDDKSKGKPKKKEHSISYAAERVIGNGSFGVVYQATVIETGETVAIKKVLQDRRFKNRELQIMGMLDHPDVVSLKHCFYSKGEKVNNPDDVFLNLVMEYIPETIHRTLRNHTKARKLVPIMYTKVYMYQVARSLAYIHSLGICHRDIKPQNLLLNTKTHDVKLCDFGSAKILIKGEPNVAYICSRYYRAPELVFEATEYSTSIDIWSLGCVMAELLLGKPLFPGDSGVDQLIEIIKILGTPTKEQIQAMNPNHTSFKFPQIKPHPWTKVFKGKAPPDAIDLVSKFLHYEPYLRLNPFESLAHPFFDELREPNARLPNGKPLPNIYNFTDPELKMAEQMCLTRKLIPAELIKKLQSEKRLPANLALTPSHPPQHLLYLIPKSDGTQQLFPPPNFIAGMTTSASSSGSTSSSNAPTSSTSSTSSVPTTTTTTNVPSNSSLTSASSATSGSVSAPAVKNK